MNPWVKSWVTLLFGSAKRCLTTLAVILGILFFLSGDFRHWFLDAIKEPLMLAIQIAIALAVLRFLLRSFPHSGGGSNKKS